MTNDVDFAILGGGIAGLVTAREILKRGQSVALIERDRELGGLARTVVREGFRFDLGGHRFHSHNPSVVQWLKDLLGTDLLTVPRFSRIHLQGRFVEYPIRFPGALSIFSPPRAALMLGSFLAAKLTEREREDVSFEDWVVRRYGKALYRVFFEPYTEKVWGIPCRDLSATWASQRIGIPSMWRAIRHAISPPKEQLATAISEFYYPRSGFGMIADALGAEIRKRGGDVMTGFPLSRLAPDPDGGFNVEIDRGEGDRTRFHAKKVISSLPLNYLLAALPPELGSRAIIDSYQLDYRDIICVFLALKTKNVSTDSWTYFPSANLIFGRTHEPKNWSSEMVPSPDVTSLAVEIFSSRGEPVWMLPDGDLIENVVDQMVAIGWIRRADFMKGWVLRVPNAYPVYRIGYQDKLQHVKDYLSQWPDLHLVGRTGSFRYMNSDGVIEDVFELMTRLFPEGAPEVEAPLVDEGRWV
ncbi:MAG: FAD-dependent oxidoreductase [Acidobacteriota bacterium]